MYANGMSGQEKARANLFNLLEPLQSLRIRANMATTPMEFGNREQPGRHAIRPVRGARRALRAIMEQGAGALQIWYSEHGG